MTDHKQTENDADTNEADRQAGVDEQPESQSDLLASEDQGQDTVEQADAAPAEATEAPIDEAEPETPPDEPPQAAPPAPKAKGRVLAFFALLLALAAAGGVGYLYYLLVYQDPMAQVKAQTVAVESQFESAAQSLSEQVDGVRQDSLQALENLRQEQSERLAANEKAVAKSLNEALQAAPPSQREWKLAEAEYLMRIANHRVLMEGDSAGALNLLLAADQILADLDDFALHTVRARMADEIIALKQVRRDDLQGIYLRLEALKTGVGRLPLLVPEMDAPAPPEAQELTVWQMMGAQLKDLIRIRDVRADESIKPLLAPDEFRYLELNLRLSIEQAQLATLKRQQDVFEQSLNNVSAWLHAHADREHEATQALSG